MRCIRTFLSLLALVLSARAFAGETGSVSGVARDAGGGALPGVTVSVKGPLLPAGRQTVTDKEGEFRFPSLPSGTYTVSAGLSGMGTAEKNAVVAVDKDTQVSLVLRQAVTSEVAVTAEALPLVDVKSTEVALNVNRDALLKLPLGRTYKELFQLTPGTFDNPARSGVNAGGNREDNLFLADGINITNPFYADINSSFISELDIQEVNLKRGGITAEFGRTAGFVTNVVTKSGTNDFHGEGRVEWQPKNASAKYSNGTIGSSRDRILPALGVGGPLVKDMTWFYVSGSYIDDTLTNRTNAFNVRTNSTDPPTVLPDQISKTKEFFAKLTAAPSPAFFLFGSFRYKKGDTENGDIGNTSSPTIATNNFTKDTYVDFGGTWFAGPNSYLEVKYNRLREDNGSTPLVDLGYKPTFDAAHPDRMGQFTTTPAFLVGGTQVAGQVVGAGSFAKNDDNFRRDQVKLTFSHYLKLGPTDHELKAGFGYDENGEVLDRVANGWGSVGYSTSAATCSLGGAIPASKAPCFTANYVSAQGPQKSKGRLWSIFLQDRITFGNRLSVMLGVLANRDDYIAGIPATGGEYPVLSFSFGDQIQPRIGVAFVPDLKVNDKVYGNYGRYYNSDNKALARNGSRYRIFSTNARFDVNGNFVGEVPASAEVNKVILPGVKPQYTDEFILGYARPLFGKIAVEIWGQYRNTKNMFDDFPTTGVNTANPGNYVYGNLDNARRRYRALTLEFTKNLSDNWYANVSYTLSRLEGNWDLDSFGDSRNYNSSSLQDGPGFYVEDPNRDGILAGDRTHIFKFFGSYTMFGVTAGGYLRVQSGTPYEARGFGDYAGNNLYIEPAGSRRTTTWTNFDLLLSYQIPLEVLGVRLEARVFNVFNSQPALTLDNRFVLANQVPNAGFETPTSFATPRRFSLTAYVTF